MKERESAFNSKVISLWKGKIALLESLFMLFFLHILRLLHVTFCSKLYCVISRYVGCSKVQTVKFLLRQEIYRISYFLVILRLCH